LATEDSSGVKLYWLKALQYRYSVGHDFSFLESKKIPASPTESWDLRLLSLLLKMTVKRSRTHLPYQGERGRLSWKRKSV
jgi:hypothetical protein